MAPNDLKLLTLHSAQWKTMKNSSHTCIIQKMHTNHFILCNILRIHWSNEIYAKAGNPLPVAATIEKALG